MANVEMLFLIGVYLLAGIVLSRFSIKNWFAKFLFILFWLPSTIVTLLYLQFCLILQKE
ncbi:hypothetical protein [Bacillus sp. MUM 116]|uniref:hypothetical protein n=1 Tax=Bacillus sp. MUM 116 TaxID=1678002 RepID=UPI0015A5623D|nr:hypothetical protein [Bacillus sp. MUM 116]